MKIYITGIWLLFALAGCDVLDYNETTGRTKEEAYAYFANMNSLVSYIYSFLPSDLGNAALMESATDNSLYTWENSTINYIRNGTWSALKRVDDGWTYWNGIRAANSFLENFDPSVLERFEHNVDYAESVKAAGQFPSEVRFLRAFYLFELAKRYGDIPLLTRTYSQEEINMVKKTSFDEVVDYIVRECEEIAPLLPLHQEEVLAETGRITRGAVLALKSRALLYAASPWHNSSNELVKWEKAAKAAGEVINLNQYSLSTIVDGQEKLYSPAGGNDVLKSKQLILERRNATKTSTFEARNEPMGYEGAQGGNTPTQNLVDAYERKDGTPFDWNNMTHVSEMYYDVNGKPTRDPRLYLNVLTNGAVWQNRTVETFEGGWNMLLDGSTKTGYYLCKYMNPSVSLDPITPNVIEHHYILFRYAEILLNYAEAMNEWVGPDAKTDGCPLTARDALNMVRQSAGMPNVVASDYATFVQKVRNERRVELAYEGHRFYDIRRWLIADSDEVRNIYGVKITRNEDSFTYERVLLEKMYWDNKMYLYPFPQNEVYLNENLTQNPGWK